MYWQLSCEELIIVFLTTPFFSRESFTKHGVAPSAALDASAGREQSHRRHIDSEPELIQCCHVNNVCGYHRASGTFPPCSELPYIYASYLSTNRGYIGKPKPKYVEITSRISGSGVSHLPASGATQEGAHAARCGPAISDK